MLTSAQYHSQLEGPRDTWLLKRSCVREAEQQTFTMVEPHQPATNMALASLVYCCNETIKNRSGSVQLLHSKQTTFLNCVLNNHENLNFETKSLKVTKVLEREHVTSGNND